MHGGTFAVAAGSLLAIGLFLGAAVAGDPESASPLENEFLIEADPVGADDLEEVFTTDRRSPGVVVRYTDGIMSIFRGDAPPPPEADAPGAVAVPAIVVEEAPEPSVVTEAVPEPAVVTEATPEPAVVAEEAPEPTVVTEAAAEPTVVTEAAPVPTVVAEEVPEPTVVAEAAPAIGMLSADGIRTHLVGNTTTRFLRGGWRTEYFAPDGRIVGRWQNFPFEGTWAVRGDAMCFDYAGSQRDFCARLSLDEATVSLYTTDGIRYDRTLSLLPGNPGNL